MVEKLTKVGYSKQNDAEGIYIVPGALALRLLHSLAP